jgi:hypothetical protein
MALNNDTNFPPSGPAPYRINREWCVGDSLGYINTNAENFDTRLNNLENNSLTTSPFYNLNNLNNTLKTAPIFIPANYNIIKNESEDSNNNGNDNIILENRTLNSDTAEYAGDIKDWWSPSFFVDVSSYLGGTGKPPVVNTSLGQPRTVAALINVYFNTNPRGNNSTRFFIKKRNRQQNSDTYPNSNAQERYVEKIKMDPTGGSGAMFEAESDTSMIVYLDTGGSGIASTFSWRISSKKNDNPWATDTYYRIKINLLGFYVQYNSFLA